MKIHDGIIYHSLNPHYPQVSAVVVLDPDKIFCSQKVFMLFFFLHENIFCGYLLDAPH